ncbi:ATP-binding protein [Ramlibacter sp. MMS24-I3-19]|uniref:sensor histidine kinase n=1 Tax=Ramlibacter sp. MMS24-I3-19 TaxID=3416606 RepID=UPI003D068DCE
MPVIRDFALDNDELRPATPGPSVSTGQSPASEDARARVATTDWGSTPLGARDTWPAALSVAVETVLASKTPMLVAWGPELTVIYNGGYVRVLGQRHPWAMGRPFRELWPEIWHETEPLVSLVLRGEPVRVRDGAYVVTRGGTPEQALFDFTLTPLRDLEGPVRGVLLIISESTYRKQLENSLRDSEAQLRLMDKRKDAFLATLAHELRNPLAPIAMGAAVLANLKDDPDKVAHFANIIGRQARHMTGLVDDLLEVSRIARGLLQIEHEPVSALDVARSAVEQVQPLIDSRGQHLRVSLPARDVFLLGDHKRLVQVLVNLLQNAAKFTGVGGRIELSVSEEPQVLRMLVKDSGEGMSEDFLRCAFELFAQAHKPGDGVQAGLGIGLALVRSLVQMHGGSVQARSEGPGRGSEFEVMLPKDTSVQALGARARGPATSTMP